MQISEILLHQAVRAMYDATTRYYDKCKANLTHINFSENSVHFLLAHVRCNVLFCLTHPPSTKQNSDTFQEIGVRRVGLRTPRGSQLVES